MLRPLGARMLLVKRGAAVQQWMSFVNWNWMTAAMVVWIALIASIGYGAMLVARHGTRT